MQIQINDLKLTIYKIKSSGKKKQQSYVAGLKKVYAKFQYIQ